MYDKEIVRLHVSDGVTYVSGLGFISPNNTHNIVRQLHRYSRIICFSLLLFFFCKQFFITPATYFAYFLGFDININNFTGMIVSSSISKQVILFIANTAAFLVCTGLIWVMTLRNINFSIVFRKPNQGALSISLPIIISIGLLGQLLATYFSSGTRFFGLLITPLSDYALGNHAGDNAIKIAIAVFIVILEEILFRGAILFSLRRFGDGFAIFASSILFSIFQNGILEIISSFFLGLVLGYFTIRSSSVLTAIMGHSFLVVTLFAFNWIRQIIEPSLADAIVHLTYIILLCCAGISFIKFVRRDKNAFVLKKLDANISFRRRLLSFFSTLSFILFSSIVILSIVDRIQIIG